MPDQQPTEFEKELVALMKKHKKVIYPRPVISPDGRIGAELAWGDMPVEKPETATDLKV